MGLKVILKKNHFSCTIPGSLVWLLLYLGGAAAQPSGGPYGPIRQNWPVPKISGTVYYAAPDGSSLNSGQLLSEPTSLEAACKRAKSGDAILLRGGVYRTGNLVLNQGILIQACGREEPVLKGTRVASEWQNLGNGLWKTTWSPLFPSPPQDWWRRDREGKKTPLHRFNNDMVFVDGRFLQSAGWEGEVDENSFFIDYDAGAVYIGIDPKDHMVEITACDVAILRTTAALNGIPSDRKGYTLRGLTFTQYAYRALEIEGTNPEGISPESQHGKEVTGTTLEHCTISYCSRVAGYLRGDGLTIRHCRVSDTSTEGIYILSSNDVLLEKNIFTRNNIEQITGYYPAAVKIFNQCYRVTCRDNLVIDHPYSNGIWYDVGNVDGVFVNNWIEGVGNNKSNVRTDQLWPSDNGFFFEISKGAVCAGNVFVDCDHGLMILNASNVSMYNNTFINSTACIGRNARVPAGDHFGWHSSTGPDVDERDGHLFVNNLLYADDSIKRPLLFVWQPASLCERLQTPMLQQLDHNVYLGGSSNPAHPMVLWSPAQNTACQSSFSSVAELREAFPAFEKSGSSHPSYDTPVFLSRELGRYQPVAGFPGHKSALSLPKSLLKVLGRTGKNAAYIGAYPVQP